MGLVLDWKKKLGYRADPFQPGILSPVSKYVVGMDEQVEKFNLFLIKNNQFGIITGPPGTGKTTFLLWISEQLRRDYKAHFLDAAEAGKQLQLLDHLLSDTISFIARKLGKSMKKPAEEKYQLLLQKLDKKRHVLLVDNAGSLSKDGVDLLTDLLKKTKTHVIVADAKDRFDKIYIGKDSLGLKTPSYASEDLSLLLQKRIAAVGGVGTHPFEKKQLDGLMKKAEHNPAKLLELARDRAIELSLKAGPPPKPTAPETPTEGTAKKVGFFNIKIDKGEAPKKEEKPEEPPSFEDEQDAEMIEAILKDTEKAQKPKKKK